MTMDSVVDMLIFGIHINVGQCSNDSSFQGEPYDSECLCFLFAHFKVLEHDSCTRTANGDDLNNSGANIRIQ